MLEDTQQKVAASFPLGRMEAPEDVALATPFLASDSSSWIAGVTLNVAGGKVMV
jgi:3-oxoacyl-[acyl-carrier protein] reductase